MIAAHCFNNMTEGEQTYFHLQNQNVCYFKNGIFLLLNLLLVSLKVWLILMTNYFKIKGFHILVF